jgi:hypothetical protein
MTPRRYFLERPVALMTDMEEKLRNEEIKK